MKTLLLFVSAACICSAQCSITNASLANAVVGSAYAQPMTTSGCAQITQWTAAGQPSGGIPPGLQLDVLSGLWSGTPAVPGVFNFTVDVIDASSARASKSFALTVAPNCSISTSTLTNGALPNFYSKTVRTTGCAAPMAWSISSGSLCPGLSLDQAAGSISGMPTAPGACAFTVSVADANASASSMPLSLTIDPACAHGVTMLPSGEILVFRNGIRQRVGVDYSLSSGTLPTITWLTPVSSSDRFSLSLLRSFTLITKVQGLPWTGVGYKSWSDEWTCPQSGSLSTDDLVLEMGIGYGDGNMFSGVYPLMCCKNMGDSALELVKASCTADTPNNVVDVMVRDADGAPLHSILASPLTCSPSSLEIPTLPGSKLPSGQPLWYMFRVSVNPSDVGTAKQMFADVVARRSGGTQARSQR